MDNITHTFVGAALADSVLPRDAGRATRGVFLAVGVIAANVPDIDLLYTGIIDAPLGYLLHHRGHSHTVPGLAGLGVLVAAAAWFWPAARSAMSSSPARMAVLLALALASHLALDAGNSYGTHLFYPFSSAWYYGDAVFIFEPWLWLVLGVAVAMNAHSGAGRGVAWGLTIVPPIVLAVMGLITPLVVVVLAIAGAAIIARFGRRSPVARSAIALAASAVFIAAMWGASRQADAAVREVLGDPDADSVVDVVLNANPAVPWCWAVVTVERIAGDQGLRVRRGTLSLLPRVAPAAGCASHRLLSTDVNVAASTTLQPAAWNREWRVDRDRLRELARGNCRVRAWLQFSRVPFVDDARVSDLRFENPLSDNFSAMPIGDPLEAAPCPAALTSWVPPRIDVLGAAPFDVRPR